MFLKAASLCESGRMMNRSVDDRRRDKTEEENSDEEKYEVSNGNARVAQCW